MMAEYPYNSKFNYINDSELYMPNFSLNHEDDSTNIDNDSNINTIKSNQTFIFNQTVNILNQNEKINNNESEKLSNFGLFNDTLKPSINFDFNIPSHFNQDCSNNLKENDTKLSDKNFLNKKRKLFKIKYPNEFFIFNRGGENKNKRNIIDQFLQNEENINNIRYNKRSHSVKTRKENADNIRKKIKSRFIKTLKELINQKLKLAGSKKFFALLPQIFVCNISKDINKIMLDKTFKELFSVNFLISQKGNIANFKKYKKNIDTLEYLEKKKDISEKSNYYCYKNLKFYQIFDEYLRSKEFENEIVNLELKGEKNDYICKYIKLACNLNNFFSE